MGAQRLAGGRHRIGRMGVIDKDRRAIVAFGGQFHPATHGAQQRQHVKHILWIAAARNHKPRRNKDIFRLKAPDQRQSLLTDHPFKAQPHLLAGGVKPLRLKAQISGLSAYGDHLLAARAGNGQHVHPPRIVDVDHRHAVLAQHAGKKARLGGKILVKAVVVIQMILRKIGKSGRGQRHPIQTPLRQTVARRLHRGVGHTRFRRPAQHPVQGDRFWRCVLQRGRPIAFDARRANVDRAQPQFLPDLPRKAGDRGLAIGAGHRHHGFRLGPEPQGGGVGQRLTRIFGNHQRRIRRSQFCLGDPGPGHIGQHGPSAHAQGILDEFAAVDPRSGQGGKQEPFADLAAVHRNPRHRHLAPASGGEPQL